MPGLRVFPFARRHLLCRNGGLLSPDFQSRMVFSVNGLRTGQPCHHHMDIEVDYVCAFIEEDVWKQERA
jgi:hypothetical protein